MTQTDTRPTDTSEELREAAKIYSELLDRHAKEIDRAIIEEGSPEKLVTTEKGWTVLRDQMREAAQVLAAMSRARSTGASVPPLPDRGMVEALRAALKPFADFAGPVGGEMDSRFIDETVISGYGPVAKSGIVEFKRTAIKLGHCRTARNVLGGDAVEASRLQAIIAELKSFPPSPLLDDAIDSLERIS